MLRKTLITLMAFAALSIGSTAMGMHGGGGGGGHGGGWGGGGGHGFSGGGAGFAAMHGSGRGYGTWTAGRCRLFGEKSRM